MCAKIKKDTRSKKREKVKNKEALIEGHVRIKKDHIDFTTKRIDVMLEKDTPKMTQPTNGIEIKENLDVSEDGQGNKNTTKHLHKEENSNAKTIAQNRRLRSRHKHGEQTSRQVENHR